MKNLIVPLILLCVNGGEITAQAEIKTEQKSEKSSIHYLALGDSYTIGTAIGKDSSYASVLAQKLEQKGDFDKVDLKIIAQNGWTTLDLIEGLQAEKPDSSYDLVSLLIGVNDQYDGISLEIYRKKFRELLLWSIALAGQDPSRVFVLSIPDYGVTPAGRNKREAIATEINQFNAVNREIADSVGVQYFNITPVSRKALNRAELVADDGLHFSAGMHRLWVEKIWAGVREQLN